MTSGVRVFYFDDSYEDYDPVNEDGVIWDEKTVSINHATGHKYEFTRDLVKEIVPYEITNQRADNGCYIRIFKSKDHIRMISDEYEVK